MKLSDGYARMYSSLYSFECLKNCIQFFLKNRSSQASNKCLYKEWEIIQFKDQCFIDDSKVQVEHHTYIASLILGTLLSVFHSVYNLPFSSVSTLLFLLPSTLHLHTNSRHTLPVLFIKSTTIAGIYGGFSMNQSHSQCFRCHLI